MIINQVDASVMKPERARSKWVVYAVGSRGKTYKAYGQPAFTSNIEALDWAAKYQALYDEVTDVLYKSEPPLRGGKAAR